MFTRTSATDSSTIQPCMYSIFLYCIIIISKKVFNVLSVVIIINKKVLNFDVKVDHFYLFSIIISNT